MECMAWETDRSESIGLRNVNARLFLYYGNNYGITIGSADYEYTRQALLNRVSDYILKPVRKAELNNVLARIIGEHKRSVKEKKDADAMRQNMHNSVSLVRNMELNRLIDGSCGDADGSAGRLEALGIPSRFRYVSAAVVMVCDFRRAADGLFCGREDLLAEAILGAMGKACNNDCVSFRRNGYRHVYVLLCWESEDRPGHMRRDKADRTIRNVETGLREQCSVRVKAGAGTWHRWPESTHCSFREASQALNALNMLSNDTVLHFEESRNEHEERAVDGHMNALVRLMLCGDAENARKQICRIRDEVAGHGHVSLKELYRLRMKLLDGLEEVMNRAGTGSPLGELPLDEARDVWAYASLEETMDWIHRLASSTAAGTGLYGAASAKLAVRRALEYIHGHYAEKILLSDIAETFHVSETYFCRIFRNETGKSFVDYLTDVRMNRARELFENYSMKVYEVAELVGYRDARHFSKLYKKRFPS